MNKQAESRNEYEIIFAFLLHRHNGAIGGISNLGAKHFEGIFSLRKGVTF